MGRKLRLVMLGIEIIVTFFIVIPIILWLIIQYCHLKYRTDRNRKRFKRALEKEGLSKTVSIEIAEYIFPKIGISQISTLGKWGSIGKQDR
ncbi:MAG: hypothetical protein ACUVQY_07525 [Thermoproteota archaeon]